MKKEIQRIKAVLSEQNRVPIQDDGTGTLFLNAVKAKGRHTTSDWFPGDNPIKVEIIIRRL